MSKALHLRIRMGHAIGYDSVVYLHDSSKPGNALAQFEAELQRIVREEVEAALRARQLANEEVQRGE